MVLGYIRQKTYAIYFLGHLYRMLYFVTLSSHPDDYSKVKEFCRQFLVKSEDCTLLVREVGDTGHKHYHYLFTSDARGDTLKKSIMRKLKNCTNSDSHLCVVKKVRDGTLPKLIGGYMMKDSEKKIIVNRSYHLEELQEKYEKQLELFDYPQWLMRPSTSTLIMILYKKLKGLPCNSYAQLVLTMEILILDGVYIGHNLHPPNLDIIFEHIKIMKYADNALAELGE